MVFLGGGAVSYERGNPVRPTRGNAVGVTNPFSVRYPIDTERAEQSQGADDTGVPRSYTLPPS
jgi:hypothetical protein